MISFTSNVRSQPIESPTMPPKPVSVAASIRNCHMMSLRRAPIALRTPISRVRSVTDTSMMFITPIPPTIKPTEEITTIAMAMPPNPQCVGHLVHGFLHHARFGDGQQIHVLRVGLQFARVIVGYVDDIVLI